MLKKLMVICGRVWGRREEWNDIWVVGFHLNFVDVNSENFIYIIYIMCIYIYIYMIYEDICKYI